MPELRYNNTLPAYDMIEDISEQPTLLIIDDDKIFCGVLAKAMTKRGFSVEITHNIEDALAKAEAATPEYAIVDLKLDSESGLVLVEKLKALDPGTRIVMLTGYASVATAVEAIKLGATHYLAKPVDADEIMAAFDRISGEADTPISLTALKSFCRLRGIAKGIGETGQGSPLLPPPTPGAITAQPLQSELPAIPRKRDRGRVYDFDEGDERPFRTRINRGSA